MLWEKLGTVTSLHFNANSRLTNKGWNGAGAGRVAVIRENADTLYFRESGVWENGNSKLDFSNEYRWSRLSGNSIRLEHLRYGQDNPVVLAILSPVSEILWRCQEPHLCGQDTYSVEIECKEDRIRMVWEIAGPSKDETIVYTYRQL